MGYICNYKAMGAVYYIVVLKLLVCYSFMPRASSSPVDLTLGFTELLLNHSNLVIQKLYDLSESARYSFVNGVHKLWVYSADKPHSIISKTSPRTEIRITVTNLICLA